MNLGQIRWRWMTFAVLAAAALALAWRWHLAERVARAVILRELANLTGGQVELGAFHFQWRTLTAELDNLTVHGREPAGTPPLFHADRLLVELRLAALLQRKIALGDVQLEHPAAHIRLERDGSTNLPPRKISPANAPPARQRLFAITIRHFALTDGYALINDVRIPLVAEGGEFGFTMDYVTSAPGAGFYHGTLSWRQAALVARRYLPFRSDLVAQFTLSRDQFWLDSFRWSLPHSEIEGRAALASFTRPDWEFHYRLRLDLADVQAQLRKPNTPQGQVEFTGDGRYTSGELNLHGHYQARRVSLPYQWFHAGGIESRGTTRLTGGRLTVPDFEAWALGGAVTGRVEADLRSLRFRVESRAGGMSLGEVLAALDNPSFPVHTLHWDSSVAVDSVTSWTGEFKQVTSRGTAVWTAPAATPQGIIPAAAHLDFDYEMDRRGVALRASEITTPTTRLEMDGALGAQDSALAVQLDTSDLTDWDDFINHLRGADAVPRRVAGQFHWQGKLTGPLGGPTFAGHVRAWQAIYDWLHWDAIEGDMTYSPDEFRLTQVELRRSQSSATLGLWLELDNWGFKPQSRFTLNVKMERADTDEMQDLFGITYPARGRLTGVFLASGTRSAPELEGTFDLTEVEAWKFKAQRISGQLNLSHELVSISRAVVEMDGGRIAGSFAYHVTDQSVDCDLSGSNIALEKIERIQTATLPLGGRFDFALHAKGPLRTVTSQGSLQLTDLRVGPEVLGSFEGRVKSNGRSVHLDLDSAMVTGKLHGGLDLTLASPYALRGEITVEQIDLDPFIETGLRLKALTGHSRVDGRFQISGELAHPDAITVQADLSRVSFDYEYVKLENTAPLRLVYRRNQVRVEQASLRGPDSEFTLSGTAHFSGDRPLDLRLAGTVNLRLAGGFVPNLEARGVAQADVLVGGTISSPRVTGRAHVENGAATYGDFPASISQVKGDFHFDRNRLLFENVSAQIGGGAVGLSGSISYGDGQLRYDIGAETQQVRVRYPEGMSWLIGGTARLTGTTQGGLLSGRIVVERLLLANGVDLATLAGSSRAGRPAATSPFLRQLQLDLEVVSSPEARLEWTGARLDVEASLKVRGTAENPVILGHIHLLSGEMNFRGDRYRLTRGDINFANPFRFDPILNVEATTTIQQYEVTLDFTGPASRINLSYRSDPPLPESDVLALLAVGRTGEESALRTAGSSQSQEAGASMLLSEAISSQVGGRLERLFGISRFQVDPFLAGTGTESNAAARVTIVQQVAHDLTITYSTNTASSAEQVIQIEYAVSRDISILALRDINGTFGLDIKFKKHFK